MPVEVAFGKLGVCQVPNLCSKAKTTVTSSAEPPVWQIEALCWRLSGGIFCSKGSPKGSESELC